MTNEPTIPSVDALAAQGDRATPHTMPTRDGDLRLERAGLYPIPEDARYGGLHRVLTVWFTPLMAPVAIFTGSLAAASFIGLSYWQGIAAIVLGTVLGTAPVGVVSAMGPKTGMAQVPFARLPFGKSIVLPGLINWASNILWDGINGLFGGEAFKVLFHTPFWFGLAVIIAAQGALGILGYEAIHTFAKWMAALLAVIFVVVTIRVATVGTTHISATAHGMDAVGGFILMVTIVASGVLPWCAYGSDYTRYMDKDSPSWGIIWRTIVGIGVPWIWLMVLGLSVAHVLGQETARGISTLLGGGVLGAIGMIAICLTTIAADAMDDYTGSLSLQASGVRISRPISAAVVAVGGFAAAMYMNAGDLTEKFTNILLLFSYWVAPFAAIVLVDWRLRRGRFDVSRLARYDGLPLGWPALIAFLAGCGSVIPFMNSTYFVGPVAHALHGGDIGYYVGFLVAAAIYFILDRLGSRTDRAAPDRTFRA